jgi:glycosyltransferase involved in cell wall biosynthesis
MRIIHCLRAPVGGLFRHVLDLASRQIELGHEVGLIADATANDALTEDKFAAIAPRLTLGVARFPMHRAPSLTDFTVARSVRDVARATRADILHGHGAKGGAYARLAGRKLKADGGAIKTFYTPHGGTLNYAPTSLEGRAFMMLERILEPMTDGLIFESAFAAKAYADRLGGSKTPRRVIPNGLQPRDFEPRELDPDAADFLFVGELRTLKGVDVLLRALAQVNASPNLARSKPLRAVIVGAGPDRDSFTLLAHDLGLAPHVTFPGAMPAKAAFPLGHVIVVPSRKESFPYIVLEAAAAGLPMIATNVGGIPEIIAGTDTTLIAADNVDALALALRHAVDRVDVAMSRAQRLRDSVACRFTVARMSDDVLAFYSI